MTNYQEIVEYVNIANINEETKGKYVITYDKKNDKTGKTERVYIEKESNQYLTYTTDIKYARIFSSKEKAEQYASVQTKIPHKSKDKSYPLTNYKVEEI